MRLLSFLLPLSTAALLCACSPRYDAPLLPHYPAPVQIVLEKEKEIPLSEEVVAKPRAIYRLEAHVLAVKRYRFTDLADEAPLDFALAWGPAADALVLAKLEVRQSNRWFYWRVRDTDDEPALPLATLGANMANVHIVPANKSVAKELKRVRPGMSLLASGKLVDLKGPRGVLPTSLSRTDTGAGSCEIFYVEALELVKP